MELIKDCGLYYQLYKMENGRKQCLVMVDKKTFKIMETEDGQPYSYVKEEILRVGNLRFARVFCLGIYDSNGNKKEPIEILVELYTNTIISH